MKAFRVLKKTRDLTRLPLGGTHAQQQQSMMKLTQHHVTRIRNRKVKKMEKHFVGE